MTKKQILTGYTCKSAMVWLTDGYNKQIKICASIYKDKELAKSIYGEDGVRRVKITVEG